LPRENKGICRKISPISTLPQKAYIKYEYPGIKPEQGETGIVLTHACAHAHTPSLSLFIIIIKLSN
jgi:hypothetical protein